MSCAMALLALTLAPQAAAGQEAPKDSWMIFAPRVYTGDGVLEDQIITVQDGKIRSITAGSSQDDRSLNVAAVTPGMIDLSVRLLDSWSGVEHQDELSPGMRAVDAVDLFDERWRAVARTGVTAATFRLRSSWLEPAVIERIFPSWTVMIWSSSTPSPV